MKEKANKGPSSSLSKFSHRIQRFAIKLPVGCRERNQEKSRDGRAENSSQSGSIFRAPEPLSQDTVLELTFALPSTVEGETGATVLCDGRTIRTILPASSDESPGVAVKIMNYRFKRTD